MKRWKCRNCNAIGTEDLLCSVDIVVERGEVTIVYCPACGDTDVRLVCDEPGCEAEMACGFPTPDGGYRRTCYKHSIHNEEGSR